MKQYLAPPFSKVEKVEKFYFLPNIIWQDIKELEQKNEDNAVVFGLSHLRQIQHINQHQHRVGLVGSHRKQKIQLIRWRIL